MINRKSLFPLPPPPAHNFNGPHDQKHVGSNIFLIYGSISHIVFVKHIDFMKQFINENKQEIMVLLTKLNMR